MIGKIKKGRSFGGCIRYVTQKDDAEIIASEGVLLGTAEEMARSFRWQCLLNPDVAKPVGHIALSFKPEDAPRLTDAFMARLAGEYLELMGIRNTQFIVVRHHGTDNPHCHIVFNRVDFDGKVISDSNDFRRNEKVTKMLKDKYSLTYSEGKQSVKTEKLHASEKVKYEIYRAVKEALRSADTWKEFQNKLLKMGVEMEFKYKENTNEVQGIRFIKNGLSFKGSGIDRSFSWSRLDAALDHNHVTSLEMTFPKSNRTMNKVMVLLLITWSKSPVQVACSCRRCHRRRTRKRRNACGERRSAGKEGVCEPYV